MVGDAALETEVELDPEVDWLVRCDRVDFPPRGIAYRHVHPGPGIRRLLFGELTIESPAGTHTYRPGDAWFEGANFPVLATASAAGDTAFVRVLLLPAEWAGKRTIRYVDPADDERPRLQRATLFLEEPLGL
jgi:quercetin dioxygenase-like cupin family protein